jgi:hypothetical protein
MFLINGFRVLVSGALVLVASSVTFILAHVLRRNWLSFSRIRLLIVYDVTGFA